MRVLLGAVGELAGTEATPDNAESLVEEFGSAARMLGAVIRNTTNPTMLGAGDKVLVMGTPEALVAVRRRMTASTEPARQRVAIVGGMAMQRSRPPRTGRR